MIDKICCYSGTNYNIIPAILVTPLDSGFIIAFKFMNGHLGFRVTTGTIIDKLHTLTF